MHILVKKKPFWITYLNLFASFTVLPLNLIQDRVECWFLYLNQLCQLMNVAGLHCLLFPLNSNQTSHSLTHSSTMHDVRCTVSTVVRMVIRQDITKKTEFNCPCYIKVIDGIDKKGRGRETYQTEWTSFLYYDILQLCLLDIPKCPIWYIEYFGTALSTDCLPGVPKTSV